MPTVPIELPHHRYEVAIEAGLLSRLGQQVREVAPHGCAALLRDAGLPAAHAAAAHEALEREGYAVTDGVFATSERLKSLDTVRSMYELLLGDRLERRSPVVALGGGILTDTAGFAAATYLRGVPLVMVPTTLLAMVDASVGGKVGVNVPEGKNLIGAFYQPMRVVIDPQVLTTLPTRELRCGLAECIKHAMIRDAARFEWLENNLDAVLALEPAALAELVRWNVQIKAQVVMADEKEAGERAHLNFGHTFAHAIEAVQGQDDGGDVGGNAPAGGCHHGEAVALGMVAATTLAMARQMVEAPVLRRLEALLERAGLPSAMARPLGVKRLNEAMALDKKVADTRIRLVLPRGIGEAGVYDDVPADAIASAWEAIGAGGE